MQLSSDDLWVLVVFIQTPTRSPARSSGGSPALVQLIKSAGINTHRRAEEGGFTTTHVKGVFCLFFVVSGCISQTREKHLRGFQEVFWHSEYSAHIILNVHKKNKHLIHTNAESPSNLLPIKRKNMNLQTLFTHAR